jgi:nicotinamidase/pyrazinamidase
MIDHIDSLKEGDGLLLVDVQNDFCPGGNLPIKGGDKIVPVLNKWIEAAQTKGIPIYASRDWHPVNHMSFEGHGGKWPPHCIQDSEGAMFHPGLKLPDNVVKITKGVRFDQDQNSAFDQTGFAEQLKRDGVRHLWIGGLALDVCVLTTVLDARRLGFEVHVILEATRSVTIEGGEKAIKEMHDAGAKMEETGSINASS